MIRNDEMKCFDGVAGGDAAKVCQKALLIFREGTDAAQRLATGLGAAVDNVEAAIKPFEAATMGGVMVSGEPFSMFGVYQLDRDASAADEAQRAMACLSDAITDAFCGFEEMWRKALGAIGLSKSQWLLDYVCDEAHDFAMWGKVHVKEESTDNKYHDFTDGNYTNDVQRLKSAILQALTAAKADTQAPRKPKAKSRYAGHPHIFNPAGTKYIKVLEDGRTLKTRNGTEYKLPPAAMPYIDELLDAFQNGDGYAYINDRSWQAKLGKGDGAKLLPSKRDALQDLWIEYEPKGLTGKTVKGHARLHVR